MDILQQALEIRLRRKAHGSIMVYEPQPLILVIRHTRRSPDYPREGPDDEKAAKYLS
jgi:hypothetical protein